MNPHTSARRSKMTIGDGGGGFILPSGEAVSVVIPYRQFTLYPLFILYPLFLPNRRYILDSGQIKPSVYIDQRTNYTVGSY
jgi:hypothetical protein